jgi:hypothetical protein
MPWCRTTPQTVGVANLTAKILCRHHNIFLSPVDAAGKHACNTLDHCVHLGGRQLGEGSAKRPADRFSIDGPLFERWLAKAAVNLLVARAFSVADGAMFLEPVPEQLIRFVFGVESLPSPRGLYVAFQPNELVGPKDAMSIDLVASSPVGLLGVLFYIQGFRFVLWFGSEPPPNPLELPGAIEPAWQQSYIYRHLGQLHWVVNETISHYIDFSWPENSRTTLKLYSGAV